MLNNNSNNCNGENGYSTSSSVSRGLSFSNDGSVGSPYTSRSELTPSKKDVAILRGGGGGDDVGASGTKRKRGQRAAVGGDNNVRGLRQFSMKVYKKVETKGRTSYNEVADELVAEFQDSISGTSIAAPDQQPQCDEKNIRRRVYDALNVLEAMDIIFRDKREIQWNGFTQVSSNDIEVTKAERLDIRNRNEKKAVYLKELEENYIGLQNLMQRNKQLYCSGNVPTGGVALPFILVQTRQHATVEVEISEDMQLVHFDFNSTPFELHDDSYILKAMNICEKISASGGKSSSSIPNVSQPPQGRLLPSRPSNSGRPPASLLTFN